MSFEAPPFAPKTIQGVEIRVGETALLSTSLELTEERIRIVVEASAERPVIEPDRTQQADFIEAADIRNLPINRRDYLDLALLTPGVVDTNYMADDSDFRAAQTPQSGLGIGGYNGRGNAFSIDGAANYYNSGGVRPSVSQDAVQEFQVNRNSFSAQLGGATGGALNIVTKSGTNEVHGSVFGFLRHRSFQARNYFDPETSAFTRGQYGFSVGGPLKKGKTFLFGAFERLDRHETAFVPILQGSSVLDTLTPSQEELASFLEQSGVAEFQFIAGAMRAALVPGANPLTRRTFDENSGTFPFSEDRTQAMLRLDHRFSDTHNLFFRTNWTGGINESAQFGALIARNRGRDIDSRDASFVLSDTWVINPEWISETRVAFGYNKLALTPVDPNGPALDIAGFGFFGRDWLLPSSTIERSWQLQQNLTRIRGRGTLKFGVDINPVRDAVRSETLFSGRFNFGEAVPLGLVLNSASGNPNLAQELAPALAGLGRPDLAAAVGDPISSLQAFSLGLPVFYQQGFGDPNWLGWFRRYNFYVEDVVRPHSDLQLSFGLRYEFEGKNEGFPSDDNNFAPRFGFAWNPGGGNRTVIRGGYGIFFARIDAQIVGVAEVLGQEKIVQTFLPLTGLPGLVNPATGGPLTSADVYQGLLAQGVLGTRPIQPEDLEPFGLVPRPGAPFRALTQAADDFTNAYGQQASFEIERAVGEFAVSAAYNFNRGLHLVRPRDRNVIQTGVTEEGIPTFGFIDPALLQNNFYESAANSFYHALVLKVSRRFARGYTLGAHYTWSKAIDEATDFNTDFGPHNQTDARADRGLSHFHRGGRFVAHAVAKSPYTAGRGRGFKEKLLGDFVVSTILVARSFAPFNVSAGFDSLGDRHTTTHRPHRAGRNIGKGPNFFAWDFRIARKFPFGEGKSVEAIAEAFNLLNRTNFKNVNNVVGDLSLEELPHPIVARAGTPSDPLSFTSAFDPRQFQFGLRVNF